MEDNTYSLLYKLARRLFQLKIEDARLTLAVKLTKLFGAIVVAAVSFILFLCIMTFVSIALANLLSDVMQPAWAYLIIAGFYALVLVVIILARRALVMDPIARFISRLIIESPKHEE